VAFVVVSRLVVFIILTAVLIAARWPLTRTWISEHPGTTGIITLGFLVALPIIFGRPRAVLLASFKSERIAIAEVYAAILSIFIAALSAYALQSYDRLAKIEREACEKAGEINKLRYEGSRTRPPAIYDSSDAKTRQTLVTRFTELAFVENAYWWLPPAERGREAFHIMIALFSHYPFPARPVHGHPLFFTSIEQLRPWALELTAFNIHLRQA
jgi:hypothetical protein